MTESSNLDNLGILVTRPAHQAQHFIELLQQVHAQVIPFATIAIDAVKLDDALKTRIDAIQDYQILIFISPNAVSYGLQLIPPSELRHHTLAAIGRSTQKALKQAGFEVDLVPESGYTSEHLLQLDALKGPAIEGKKVLIVRGMGGREQLALTLSHRGADVDYAEVYTRTIPESDNRPILEQWAQGAINLITVTSNLALENLYQMLGESGTNYINTTALIVPGKRCFECARDLGHKGAIQIAKSALDMDMFQAILDWQNNLD